MYPDKALGLVPGWSLTDQDGGGGVAGVVGTPPFPVLHLGGVDPEHPVLGHTGERAVSVCVHVT